MDFKRKDNLYQGSHGVGRHDEGGNFGNYSNFQDKEGKNWKKIITIVVGLVLVVSIIGLIAQNSGGTSVPQGQAEVAAIAKDQDYINVFINEFEDDLNDRDSMTLSAHISAINFSNQKALTDYYNANFATLRLSKQDVTEKITETMKEATDRGDYDEVYYDELLSLVEDHRNEMKSLFSTTTKTNLKDVLETSYDNFEYLDRLK